MNKNFIKIGAASGLIALSAAFMSAGLAYGRNGADDSTSASAATSVTETGHTTEVETNSHMSTTEHVKGKLDDAKKKVCKDRTNHIEDRMTKIVTHANHQLAVFDKIAARTQAFADAHIQKPANYDALVADVAAKRKAAVDGLAALKTDQTSFTCDGDAHGVADSFKTALKSEIALLKSYKTSIRNLIVGVKSSKAASGPDDTKTSTDTSTQSTETK